VIGRKNKEKEWWLALNPNLYNVGAAIVVGLEDRIIDSIANFAVIGSALL